MCYVYGSLTRHLMKNNRVVTETSQIKFCLLPKKSKLCHSLNIHSAHDTLQRYTVTLSGKIQIWSDACNYWLDMNYVPSSKPVPVRRNVWMYLYTNTVQHLLDIHQSAVRTTACWCQITNWVQYSRDDIIGYNLGKYSVFIIARGKGINIFIIAHGEWINIITIVLSDTDEGGMF